MIHLVVKIFNVVAQHINDDLEAFYMAINRGEIIEEFVQSFFTPKLTDSDELELFKKKNWNTIDNRFPSKKIEIFSYGWFQSLFREKVKSQSIGNLTLNSESA